MMNAENWNAAFADEAFVKSLFELETAAEVQAALKEKDVELTKEEILGIRELLAKVESGEITPEQLEQWAALTENGELTEEMLEQVAGGVLVISIGALAMVALKVLGVSAGVIAVSTGISYGIVDAMERRW